MKYDSGIYSGIYRGCGTDTFNNAKETPFFYITFEITHQAVNGQWQEVLQRENRDVKFFLTDNAWEYTQRDLSKLGFNGDFEMPDFPEEFKATGQQLSCAIDTNNGKAYENWSFPYDGGHERKTVDRNHLKKLSAKFKQAERNNRPPAGTPPMTPQAGQQDNTQPQTDQAPPQTQQPVGAGVGPGDNPVDDVPF